MTGPDPTEISPDKVVERLLRDPIGERLWRACVAEEIVDAQREQLDLYRKRVEQLEQQKSPASTPPNTAARPS